MHFVTIQAKRELLNTHSNGKTDPSINIIGGVAPQTETNLKRPQISAPVRPKNLINSFDKFGLVFSTITGSRQHMTLGSQELGRAL
ncbi:hypothetical protein Tsubulata_015789 [Turnera subulata]|uniref:Uncharacterized protein n=1 Tax=Turnera subulata TaxID=218843 RepID=A0A9Q0FV12_9ROSI|nr:hypothetical protein Tsubulata_015789 [Turnera subulata]